MTRDMCVALSFAILAALLVGLPVGLALASAPAPVADRTGQADTWRTVPSPTGNSLWGVDMVSASEGWAVGDSGTILHRNGTIWQSVPSPTTHDLLSVDMVSAEEGWAVGGGGADTILHYSGGSWQAVQPTGYWLNGVDMVSASEGWAVGSGGTILHYSGGAWQPVSNATTKNLNGVHMVSVSEGWAVGSGGTILHYSGSDWQPVPSPTGNYLRSVYMVSPSEGWAVGQSGTILHYSAGTWQTVSSPTGEWLHSVAMTSENDGWAVGVNGTILRYSEGGWQVSPSPTSSHLTSVMMTSESDGWAVGGSGAILHYSGTSGISGRVTDGSNKPISGVTVSAGAAGSATTGPDGAYTITELAGGTYTLTPNKPGFGFIPPTRSVSVPPDAIGQNFTMLAAPVSITLASGLEARLTYTDTQGLPTSLDFPPDAVTQTTTVALTPTLASGGTGYAFAGHAFELAAYQGGSLQSGFTFGGPVTVTVHYSDSDVRTVTDEERLALWWRNGGEWQDAAQTCEPTSSYSRDVANNALSVPICHLSLFGFFGPTQQVYLPLIVLNP